MSQTVAAYDAEGNLLWTAGMHSQYGIIQRSTDDISKAHRIVREDGYVYKDRSGPVGSVVNP